MNKPHLSVQLDTSSVIPTSSTPTSKGIPPRLIPNRVEDTKIGLVCFPKAKHVSTSSFVKLLIDL